MIQDKTAQQDLYARQAASAQLETAVDFNWTRQLTANQLYPNMRTLSLLAEVAQAKYQA